MASLEKLTAQMDMHAETRDLESAMQVSLVEAEQERQKQKAPAEMSDMELKEHFKGSLLFKEVGSMLLLACVEFIRTAACCALLCLTGGEAASLTLGSREEASLLMNL